MADAAAQTSLVVLWNTASSHARIRHQRPWACSFISHSEIMLTHVEDTHLFLPSELNEHDCCRYCPAGLVGMENCHWYAEATDALEDLHHHLHTQSFTNQIKAANVMGQINNTHLRETQHCIDNKVQHSELHYSCVCTTLLVLRGNEEWEQALQVLHRSDVRALNERQMTDRTGKRWHVAYMYVRRWAYRQPGWCEGCCDCSGYWWRSTLTLMDMVFGQQPWKHEWSTNAHWYVFICMLSLPLLTSFFCSSLFLL